MPQHLLLDRGDLFLLDRSTFLLLDRKGLLHLQFLFLHHKWNPVRPIICFSTKITDTNAITASSEFTETPVARNLERSEITPYSIILLVSPITLLLVFFLFSGDFSPKGSKVFLSFVSSHSDPYGHVRSTYP